MVDAVDRDGLWQRDDRWRRLRDWQVAGVWDWLHQKLLETLEGAEQLDWSRASLDAGMVPAPGVVEATGPSL
jgi:hypothetical protein